MNRTEAIQSLLPDACPTCGGVEFRVTSLYGATIMLDVPTTHSIQLVCTACEWNSPVAFWQHDGKPEIVYSDDFDVEQLIELRQASADRLSVLYEDES